VGINVFATDGSLEIQTAANTQPIIIGQSATALATFTSTALTLGAGVNLVMASGKGIDFSAYVDGSVAGTTTSEVLSDYEEGTWTPAVAFGGASVGITYGTNSGTYTKVGRKVTALMNIALSAKGSSVGGATVSGFPFTNGSVPAAAALRMSQCTFANQYGAYLDAASTTMYFQETTEAGALTNIADTDFTNSTGFIASVTYFV
jgi:hypothetical protein